MDSFVHLVLRTVSLALASGGALIALTGCTLPLHPERPDPYGTNRPALLVLDFEVLPRLVESRDENRRKVITPAEVETTKDRRGWWFNSQNVYINSNAGRLVATELARELEQGGPFTLTSREDLKIYMADKADALKDTLKLSDPDARRATGVLDPVQVGREMGARYVIRGQVVDLEMRHSRVFGLFAAGGTARAAVFNTQTGQMEHSVEARQMRFTGTTLTAAEALAKDLANQIRARYLPASAR